MITAVLLLLLFATVSSLRCFKCEGGPDCAGDFCSGDYCFINNVWIDGPRVTKGCSKGNLWQQGLEDRCVTYDRVDADSSLTDCFCSSGDLCNRKSGEPEKESSPTVNCYCDDCDESDRCTGDYCAFWYDHKSKQATRGCLDTSIPMLRDSVTETCEMPPILGTYDSGVKYTDLENLEQCICSTDLCNRKKPADEEMNDDSSECELLVQISASKFDVPTTSGKCRGQYCYIMEVNDTSPDANLLKIVSMGCMTLSRGARLGEGLNYEGCQTFESDKLSAQLCLKTDTPPPAEPEPPTQPEPQGDAPDAGPPGSVDGEPSYKTTHIVYMSTKTPAVYEDDSNTTLVAVFVVIMIIIVIAGVIWKFELHKKIFRSHYESVAG